MPPKMQSAVPARLGALMAAYMAASLVHFIHNAEFLAEYPGLPDSWTRAGVYCAWLGIAAIGAAGLLLLTRGFRVLGSFTIAVCALLGMDSLGHYVVAPFSAHTSGMNLTILLEVGTAALVLLEATHLMLTRTRVPS